MLIWNFFKHQIFWLVFIQSLIYFPVFVAFFFFYVNYTWSKSLAWHCKTWTYLKFHNIQDWPDFFYWQVSRLTAVETKQQLNNLHWHAFILLIAKAYAKLLPVRSFSWSLNHIIHYRRKEWETTSSWIRDSSQKRAGWKALISFLW